MRDLTLQEHLKEIEDRLERIEGIQKVIVNLLGEHFSTLAEFHAKRIGDIPESAHAE